MQKLKIGILIDDTDLPKYQAEVLSELQKSDLCEIALFVKKQKSSDPYLSSRYSIYRLLKKLDSRVFGRSTPYLANVSIKTMIEDTNTIEIQTQESDYFDEIYAQDHKDILAQKVDLFINFGFKSFKDNFINIAKHGIWEFCHTNRPAAFWEVVENNPFTEVTLQRVGSGMSAGFVLDRFRTVTDRKSMRKNYELVMWRSHMMLVRNIHRLAKQGESYFDDKEAKSYFYDTPSTQKSSEKKLIYFRFGFSDDKGKSAPSNCQALRASCKLLGKYTKYTVRRFFEMDRWIILFAENKNGEINPDLSSYKRLPLPSNDYFQADPFMVDEGDKTYLFYEELDYATLKGYLLVSHYDEAQQTFVDPKEVLKLDYHLSYPNVFKHQDTYYMIPETNENGTIDLYEAQQFPTKWKKIRTMIDDIKAVDATLLQKDGKWWMFVNTVEKEGFSLNDELSIFYCDDFRTDTWKAHELNPVVSDTTSARPAGNLIEKEGKLFRPAQNCGGIYGRSIIVNEVMVLNEKEYKERVVEEIRADFADDLITVHTLNSSKRFSVIDAMKSR